MIVSIWGSDFYRIDKSNRKKLLKLLDFAHTVTIPNEKARQDILDYYGQKLKVKNFVICKLTINQLYNLQELCKVTSKSESRLVFNLGNKKIITIGYNASEMQQHLTILDELEGNEELLKQKEDLQFLLPVTYPKNINYIEQLNRRIQVSPYNIVLLSEFLSIDKVSHLRNATDIMIQLQTTDMFSASMIEHLAAKNKVITGSWLPYQELLKWGVIFESINNISQISFALLKMLNSHDATKLNKNALIIEEKLSKKLLIKNWLKLYKD